MPSETELRPPILYADISATKALSCTWSKFRFDALFDGFQQNMTLDRNGDQRTLPLPPDEIQGAGARSMSDAYVQRDVALTERMVAGENAAWVDFVTQFDSLIFSRIQATWREVGLTFLSPEVAAEISSEVFAGLLNNDMKSLKGYSGRSRLSTWLSVVVRRTTLRYLHSIRKRKAGRELQEQADPRDEQRQIQASSDDRLDTLRVARKKLSVEDQQVLHLFYEKDKSYQQIADELELSVNAIGPKLDRARRRLRLKTEEINSM
jgi:RNA polymerase sigma-70 factor, ECF subfamily